MRCRDASGEETCYTKGAVESVLEMCVLVGSKQGSQMVEVEMGEKERRRILDAARALGMKGRRCVVSCRVVSCHFMPCDCHALLLRVTPTRYYFIGDGMSPTHPREFYQRWLECMVSTTRSVV